MSSARLTSIMHSLSFLHICYPYDFMIPTKQKTTTKNIHLSRNVRKLTLNMHAQWRLGSACAFAQSYQNLHRAHLRQPRTQNLPMRTWKTPTRPRVWTDRSESSLGAHYDVIFMCSIRTIYVNSKTDTYSTIMDYYTWCIQAQHHLSNNVRKRTVDMRTWRRPRSSCALTQSGQYVWQTVQTQIRRRVLRCLILAYTVCKGLSVLILRVNTVVCRLNNDIMKDATAV